MTGNRSRKVQWSGQGEQESKWAPSFWQSRSWIHERKVEKRTVNPVGLTFKVIRRPLPMRRVDYRLCRNVHVTLHVVLWKFLKYSTHSVLNSVEFLFCSFLFFDSFLFAAPSGAATKLVKFSMLLKFLLSIFLFSETTGTLLDLYSATWYIILQTYLFLFDNAIT